ncbi:unnamed protein product [Cyprideis torosa]|uniref:Uncharacterized protein n=1 Tax=Cyprideis torosa TaxID=163714 RepID=A0A7R8W9L6_9CRUS|nr:unnamed protein product [Cyprideis torosa]CAG0889955.1 unnamed protein product [Cyprideis torosa]
MALNDSEVIFNGGFQGSKKSEKFSSDTMDSDDATWILTSSFIVFTMQTGFALLESGAVTIKNSTNILIKSMIDVVLGGLAYWMFGFDIDKKEFAKPPAFGDPQLAVLGCLFLWSGSLGLNCGATFGVVGSKYHYAGRAAVSTLNGTFGGGLIGIFFSLAAFRDFDITAIIYGILAGLVSTNGGCAYYEPWEALVIGIVGSLMVNVFIYFIRYLKIEDPVRAISVHGVGGLWGTIAAALFGLEEYSLGFQKTAGLFRGGPIRLLGIQFLGILSVSAWSVLTTFALLWTINKFIRTFRIQPWEEILGADLCEHGVRHDDILDYEEKFKALKARGFHWETRPWIEKLHSNLQVPPEAPSQLGTGAAINKTESFVRYFHDL